MSENKELINEELEKVAGGFQYSEEDHAYHVRYGDCFMNINDDFILEHIGSTQLFRPRPFNDPTFHANKYVKQADGTFKFDKAGYYNFDNNFLNTMRFINRNDYILRKVDVI